MTKSLLLALCCIGAAHALYFNCKFEEKSLPIVGKVYICQPTITAGNDNRKIESVSGTHLNKKSNKDVKRLTIEQQNLPMLPYNLVSYFPNLQSIRVHNSQLQALTSLDLQPFPNMVLIDITANLLTNLESDLFRYTPNFKWISFDSNQLTSIGRNFVFGMKNLEYMSFYYNKCINRKAETKATVVTLGADLPISCPTVITSDTCPSSCLQRMDSFDSAIEKLNDEVIAMKQIGLNHSRDITDLRETTFQQNNEIQQLNNQTDIHSNDIWQLHESVTNQLAEIQEILAVIDKQDGEIESLKDSVTSQLQKLQQLEKTFDDQSADIQWLLKSFESSQENIAQLNEITANQSKDIRQLSESIEILQKILAETENNSVKAFEALEKRVYDLEGKLRELLSLPSQ